ncbi:MAG: chorismate mutase [bacterium]
MEKIFIDCIFTLLKALDRLAYGAAIAGLLTLNVLIGAEGLKNWEGYYPPLDEAVTLIGSVADDSLAMADTWHQEATIWYDGLGEEAPLAEYLPVDCPMRGGATDCVDLGHSRIGVCLEGHCEIATAPAVAASTDLEPTPYEQCMLAATREVESSRLTSEEREVLTEVHRTNAGVEDPDGYTDDPEVEAAESDEADTIVGVRKNLMQAAITENEMDRLEVMFVVMYCTADLPRETPACRARQRLTSSEIALIEAKK